MRDFTYIAFDQETGLPLTHGPTAASAAAAADLLAPDAPLYVLDAHDAGPWIWATRVALSHALERDGVEQAHVAG